MENDYQKLYDDFIAKYNKTETTPSEVGELLVRISAMYPNFNTAMSKAERAYAIVCRDEVCANDELTGKPISATKSEKIAEASEEATAFKTARTHIQNLEVLMGSLKFLQKALETEYINSGI
jgi:hypothetical protein